MIIETAKMRVSNHLDLIRGLAAMAVLVYHVRYRFFLDYQNVQEPGVFTVVFYTATAFGHDAVMVFFVLSGYFISGSVLRDRAADRWSWRRYLVNRLTRLELVLLPGLILTAFWDVLGLTLHGANPVYTGEPRSWEHDFFPVASRLHVSTFLLNALFLQTIVVPPFGSNDPLWSLSYEFWYYILFPLAWFAFIRPKRLATAAVQLAIFTALLLAVGNLIALYFPIWLMGTAVCVLPQIPALKRQFPVVVIIVALFAVCAVVAVSHSDAVRSLFSYSVIGIDYVNATAFALLLYLMLHDQSRERGGTYARISRGLADFSYTLYVVHIPVLIFTRAVLLPDAPWSPEPGYVALGALIAGAVVLYAYAISRVTEKKTGVVRDKLMRALGLVRRDSPPR